MPDRVVPPISVNLNFRAANSERTHLHAFGEPVTMRPGPHHGPEVAQI